jgi:hypothetical protein
MGLRRLGTSNVRDTTVRVEHRCQGQYARHFCMGWDVGILFDWFKSNGAKLRAMM